MNKEWTTRSEGKKIQSLKYASQDFFRVLKITENRVQEKYVQLVKKQKQKQKNQKQKWKAISIKLKFFEGM